MAVSPMAGFSSWSALPEERVTPLITRQVLTGQRAMMVRWRARAGAHAGAHRHPHEQILWMLSGRMRFRIGDEVRECGPGDVAVIPGGVEHEAWWLEDTDVVDIFSPPREDFLAGGAPAYMERA